MRQRAASSTGADDDHSAGVMKIDVTHVGVLHYL